MKYTVMIETESGKFNWVETDSWLWANIVFILYRLIAKTPNQVLLKSHQPKLNCYFYNKQEKKRFYDEDDWYSKFKKYSFQKEYLDHPKFW